MAIKAVYDNKEEIPEAFLELFEERGGKWHLVRIEGIVTQADVDRVSRSLDQEKKAHKATKEKLEAWGDHDPAEALPKLDRFDELEAAAGGQLDQAKIDDLVEKKIKGRMAPVERELTKAKKDNETLTNENGELKTTIKRGKIEGEVRRQAEGLKVIPHAIDDVVMLAERLFDVDDEGRVITRDNVGATPGLDVKSWLSDMQEKRPHWWPTSNGGGAGGTGPRGGQGGGADNPWSAKGWNITAQGQFIKQHGLEKANEMAGRVGSKVGAARPPVAA